MPEWRWSSLYPAEELLAVAVGVLETAETGGEVGPILEGPELALGVRVVVADVGSRVGLGDAEVGEQVGDGFGDHRAAAVGVDGQLVAGDVLSGDRLGEQCLGESGALGAGQHPAGHVAAPDVDDHVQVVVGLLHRAEQFGHIP